MEKKWLIVSLRISMGWIFLWAFFDKLLGLGFATKPENAWILGNSPTYGFLKFATRGPLASFYQNIAGNPIVDWLFMLGLFGIGISFLFGIARKIACYSGALLMFLMWTALLLPEHNPIVDEHIIYMLVFLLFEKLPEYYIFGLGKWWKNLGIVKKYPFLA